MCAAIAAVGPRATGATQIYRAILWRVTFQVENLIDFRELPVEGRISRCWRSEERIQRRRGRE
jgi:hypothetical protein